MNDYTFDRAYMHPDDILLLQKIQDLVKNKISDKENARLAQIIKTYTKIA